MTQELTDAPSTEEPSSVADSEVVDQAPAGSSAPDQQAQGSPEERTGEAEQSEGPTLAEVQAENVRLRESEKAAQESANSARTQIAEAALTRQRERIAAEEADARVADQQRIDDGEMTATEAFEASDKRRQEAESKLTQDQQGDQVLERLMDTGAIGNRYKYAVKFADEHEIADIRPLMDPSIKTPDEMEAKAKEIAAAEATKEDERTGDEVYDGSVSAPAAPLNTEGLHGFDLAVAAYSPAAIKEREKRARRG